MADPPENKELSPKLGFLFGIRDFLGNYDFSPKLGTFSEIRRYFKSFWEYSEIFPGFFFFLLAKTSPACTVAKLLNPPQWA